MAWISPTSVQCPEEWMTDQRAYLKFTVTAISDSDAATNKRYIGWKVTIEGTPWVALYGAEAWLGGVNIVPYDTSINVRNWYSGQIFASNITTFNNDNNGNLSLGFWMKQLFFHDDWAWSQGYAQEVSATFTCSQLLRYANFTSHTATSEINKITVTYTADANYKAQQYKIDDGEWTDTTAGSYTLTGLTPNTTYTIKTKIQRTDSGLWKESDAITITTKSLPDSISPADIDFNGTNGNTITPSLSSIDYIDEWYIIVKDGNTQVRSFSGNVSTTISKDYTLTGSDFTGMLPRHTDTDNWNLTILYKVKSNGTSYDLTNRTCKCTIPAGQYLPSYSSSNISYAVTDSLTLSLNNNNTTKVIKGISNVRVTSTAASPQGSATMSSYIASSGTKSNSGTTTTAPIIINLTQADGDSVSVQAVDSRGRSTIATKNYSVAIDYFNPVVDSSTIVRVDGIGTNLSVNISGRYCNWSGLATSNTIEQVSIQYRIKGTSTWTTKTGITFTRNVGNGNFTITGNITGNNFLATTEYELLLTFKDKISNFEILASIPTGESFLWRDLSNKRLGINKKPTVAFDVSGAIKGSSTITAGTDLKGQAVYINNTKILWYEEV